MQVMVAILNASEFNSTGTQVLTFSVQVSWSRPSSAWVNMDTTSSLITYTATFHVLPTLHSCPAPWASVTSVVAGSPCQVPPLGGTEHSLEPLGLKSIPVRSRQGTRTEDARMHKKTWRHIS